MLDRNLKTSSRSLEETWDFRVIYTHHEIEKYNFVDLQLHYLLKNIWRKAM
jgi:hypothetical protein